jgi:hypothetical protein
LDRFRSGGEFQAPGPQNRPKKTFSALFMEGHISVHHLIHGFSVNIMDDNFETLSGKEQG